jgi:predicted transcriptional regulator of viral defense system
MIRKPPPASRAKPLKQGVVRPRDVEAGGFSRTRLERMTRAGELERVGRGLYVPKGAAITEHHTLVEAAARVPHGIVCLLTALRFHELGTQNPHEVWLAVDRKARKPVVDWPPIHLVRFSGEALTFGVETRRLERVPVKITSRERTVADCFKYRNKIGLDVALEALRAYLRSKKRSVDDLVRAARVCRVARVMQPYLESMA